MTGLKRLNNFLGSIKKRKGSVGSTMSQEMSRKGSVENYQSEMDSQGVNGVEKEFFSKIKKIESAPIQVFSVVINESANENFEETKKIDVKPYLLPIDEKREDLVSREYTVPAKADNKAPKFILMSDEQKQLLKTP